MRRFSKLTAWIFRYPVLASLMLLTLSGCAHKTTISEADLYLQAKMQQVQIDSYKNQLQDTREKLTQVIPGLQNVDPVIPVSFAGDLTAFLEQNDCTQMSGKIKDQCYIVTRVKLINVTRALDEANANLYAGQKTVGQLRKNINTLVDTLVGSPDGTKPEKPK